MFIEGYLSIMILYLLLTVVEAPLTVITASCLLGYKVKSLLDLFFSSLHRCLVWLQLSIVWAVGIRSLCPCVSIQGLPTKTTSFMCRVDRKGQTQMRRSGLQRLVPPLLLLPGNRAVVGHDKKDLMPLGFLTLAVQLSWSIRRLVTITSLK